MSHVIDARGLACPQPVMLTNKALAFESVVTVIVDNEAARENVARLARSKGGEVSVESRAEGIFVTIALASVSSTAADDAPNTTETRGLDSVCAVPDRTVLVLASEGMGRGDDGLGGILLRAYLKTLGEIEQLPESIVCVNGGAKLAALGSTVLEDLAELAAKGVEILVCGTCLKFYELEEQLAVGSVSNMFEIAIRLGRATKVISF